MGKKTSRKIRPWLLMAVVILVLPFLVGFDSIARRITVIDGGKPIELRTNTESIEAVLKEAGIVLARGDSFRLRGKNTRLQDGSVIEVIRAKNFKVVRGGSELDFRSTKKTVGEALKEQGIAFGAKRVYPDVHGELKEGMRIYIVEKNEEFHYSEVPVEAPVTYKDDPYLLFGEEKVTSEGRKGKAKVIAKKEKHHGLFGHKSKKHKAQPKELGREVLEAPEDKVVHKGIKNRVKTEEGYKLYKKKMVFESTGYVATGNRTYLGLVPHRGSIAVDPRVIPFYTKMYIPGYGIGVAVDTGGAIKGKIIDLFFEDYDEAIQWGRRNVEVYFLAD